MTASALPLFAVASLGAILAGGSARAELLTFDDLPNVPHQGTMQDGYGTLDWTNFYYLDGLKNDYNPSGYAPGTVSNNNVIFNGHGNSASFSSAGAFTLSSLYVTGAWRDGLKVTLTGEFNGHVKNTVSYVVNSTSPSFIQPDFSGINKVIVSVSGGTHNPNYPSADNRQVAIDNVSLSFYASERGYSAADPFLPSSSSGPRKEFDAVQVYAGVPVYFDPAVAPAYTFVNDGGPSFSGFEVPFTDADGKYAVSLYQPLTGRYVYDTTISAGQWLAFAGAGVDRFEVSGISGYSGPATFGFTFATDGHADFTQTALTGPAPVPLPASLPSLGLALICWLTVAQAARWHTRGLNATG